MVLSPSLSNDVGSTTCFFSEAEETEHVLQKRIAAFAAATGVELFDRNQHTTRVTHQDATGFDLNEDAMIPPFELANDE